VAAEHVPAEPWRTGEPVEVVEYRDHRPRRDGQRFTGTVTGITRQSMIGSLVLIAYDDPAETGHERDQFYASTGWRAMDGEMRWKLHRGGER
jgi:hypothetical protein